MHSDITVVLPVWNAVDTISRCLFAIIDQQLQDATLLVIDNHSSDDTFSLASQILKGKPNCRVIRNKQNVGRVGNWNLALQYCQTKYLKLALVNDVLMKGSISCLTEVAHAHPAATMVCSRCHLVDSIPDRIPVVEPTARVRLLEPLATAHFFAESGCQTGGLNSMLINMDYVREHKLQMREDTPYCADYYFALQLASKGASAFVDTETYLFNASATGRYHFVGLQKSAAFFREQRECAKLLLRQTGDALLAHQYLCGQYLWYLGQGAELQARDAWETFSHAPLRMRLRATWATFMHNLKKRGRCRLKAVQASASR